MNECHGECALAGNRLPLLDATVVQGPLRNFPPQSHHGFQWCRPTDEAVGVVISRLSRELFAGKETLLGVKQREDRVLALIKLERD